MTLCDLVTLSRSSVYVKFRVQDDLKLLNEFVGYTGEDGVAITNAGFEQGVSQNLSALLSKRRAETRTVA